MWIQIEFLDLCALLVEFCKYFLTTVFVDTRLWKTKHPRKRFQNFRQSYLLSTCQIEIHQSQSARVLQLLSIYVKLWSSWAPAKLYWCINEDDFRRLQGETRSDTHGQMVHIGIGSCKKKNVMTDFICSSRYTVASSNSTDKYVIVASKFYEQLVFHDELTLSAKDWIKC